LAVDFLIKFFLNSFGTLEGAYWSIYYGLRYFSVKPPQEQKHLAVGETFLDSLASTLGILHGVFF